MPQRKIEKKNKLTRSPRPSASEITYTCSCCGKTSPRQQGTFYYNHSPLYQANGHYSTVCQGCTNALFEKYLGELGNEDEAVRRVCMKFDMYYSPEIMRATDATSARTHRMAAYCSKLSLRMYQDKTFDTTLLEEAAAQPEPVDTEEINPAWVKKWGEGFTAREYKEAEDLFQTFRSANPKADGVQLTFMLDLAKTKILQQRAFEHGDADSYTKYTKSYQETLKSSKLRLSLDDDAGDGSDENCWGKFIQQIENYTPAELYKDKGLFADADSIGEYYRRFIVRPFKNFTTGSNDPDEEYRVLPGEEEDQ